MKCKLCQQERILKNSHIITEIFYEPIYDDIHRLTYSTIEPSKDKPIQKGIREKLLCEECEQKINEFEKHIDRIWYKDKKVPFEFKDAVEIIDGIDYKKFKLFHLSVLWRASASTIPVFKHVKLGLHEEKIRKMIWDENPGNEDVYPFYAYALVDNNKFFDRLILEPRKGNYKGYDAYTFVYGGCSWLYIIADNFNEPNAVFSLRKDGKFAIVKKEIQKDENIMDALNRKFGSRNA